jgi:hypothetical protein
MLTVFANLELIFGPQQYKDAQRLLQVKIGAKLRCRARLEHGAHNLLKAQIESLDIKLEHPEGPR